MKNKNNKDSLFYRLRQKATTLFKRFVSVSKDPRHIAFSISLGILFGIIIPIGLQTLIIVPIAAILRANVYLSTSATLITNPITVVPIYYLAFKIGSYLTANELNWFEIEKIMNNPSYNNLSSLGSNILFPLLLGNLIFASVLSIIIYFAAFYIMKSYLHSKRQ